MAKEDLEKAKQTVSDKIIENARQSLLFDAENNTYSVFVSFVPVKDANNQVIGGTYNITFTTDISPLLVYFYNYDDTKFTIIVNGKSYSESEFVITKKSITFEEFICP